MADFRGSRERQALRPGVLLHLGGELRKQASASTQEDAGGQALAACELLEAERKALEQHLGVGAQQLRDLAVLLRGQEPFGMPQLACLGLFVAETERQREPAREGAAPKVEHAR